MADEKVVKIKLQEIVDLCKNYVAGNITQEEMTEYGSNMVIRQYLPILEKISIAISITTQHLFSDVDAQEVKMAELYKYMFFYGLLSGYAMIDCSDKNLVSFENYDLLYPIFAPFILNYCGHDYENFKEFIKDSLNLYNIKELMNNFEAINPEMLEKATISNKELINILDKNKELVSDIKEIKQLDNPLMSELVKTFKEASVQSLYNTTKEKKTNKTKKE